MRQKDENSHGINLKALLWHKRTFSFQFSFFLELTFVLNKRSFIFSMHFWRGVQFDNFDWKVKFLRRTYFCTFLSLYFNLVLKKGKVTIQFFACPILFLCIYWNLFLNISHSYLLSLYKSSLLDFSHDKKWTNTWSTLVFNILRRKKKSLF